MTRQWLAALGFTLLLLAVPARAQINLTVPPTQSGGGGGGAVNAVHGTAGQIVASPQTGTVVLSLPSTITPNIGFSGAVTLTGSFTATGLVTNSDLANNTISGVPLGSTLATLTFGSHLTSGGSSYNGSGGVTITSDATSANTASTIVARDGSGTFAGSLTGGASLDLAIANNLSDLASASTARTSLGLGTAATQNTGTSGATLGLLNGNLTFSGSNAYGTPASITLTNGTGLPLSGISGLGVGVSAALGTGVTGSNNIVLSTSPTITTPTVGTTLSISAGVNNSGNTFTINNRTRTDSQLAVNVQAGTSAGDFTIATNGNVTMGGNLAFTGQISGANNVAPHFASYAAIVALKAADYPNGLWRDNYGPGYGDFPHFYTSSLSPCAINSGAGDAGSEMPSVDGGCFNLAPGQVLTFAGFGAVGDTQDVNGITTTSSSTTIALPTGLSFSGRTGERFIGAGIGSGGNLLDTTVAGATTLTAAAGVSQSTASPTYFVSSKTPDGDASASCQASDVLTAPAVVNGSATVAAQITVDTVSGGHITSAHVSRGGVYTNSQPWNSNAVITFTGGHCSVGYTVAPAEQAAGNFVVGADDTSAIANACAALATGQWTRLVGAPGKNYMTVFNSGLPIGSAGSACPVPAGATLDMNGAILTSPLWGELYGGQTVAVDASDTTIRNVDMVQWPVPMDYYGSAVVTPSGTNAIAFSAGATNSIVDNPRCNGGKSAVAIFAAVAPYGGSGTGFQTARNIKINNAKSEGCTYVFTANGGAEITLNNYIAKGVDRSLIMVATQDVHAHGSAQNVVAQDIALGQPNGDFALAGVNIEHLVRRRALSTLVNAVTNSSLVVTGVQDTSNIQFGQQISGSELQTNTLVTHVDEVGNVMLSQPTVGAPGTVSWTFALPAWYPAAENGDFIIVSQSGQYYGNRFKITKDAGGDPSASVVNLARINNNNGTDTSDWFNNDLDLTVTNLPSGSTTNCTAANGYANCLVDLFQTGFTWNSVVNGMRISVNQTGSSTNPGLVHVGMSAFASALGTPLNIHDTSLLGTSISYEADAPADRMYIGPVVFQGVLQTGQLYVGSGSLNSTTLTSTVAANCDSITLPAGTYDVTVDAYFEPANATTVTNYNASVSPTSATINGTIGAFQSATFPGLILGNSTFDSFHVGPYRVTPTTNTPYYGTVSSSFGTSTMQAGCLLRAQRVQ